MKVPQMQKSEKSKKQASGKEELKNKELEEQYIKVKLELANQIKILQRGRII